MRPITQTVAAVTKAITITASNFFIGKSSHQIGPTTSRLRSRLFPAHRRSPYMETCAGSQLILGEFRESVVIAAAERALAECGGQPSCGFLFLSASWLP